MSDFPTTPPPGGPDPVPGPAPFGQASPPPWGSTPTGPGAVPPPGQAPWGGAPVPPGAPPPGWGSTPGWQPGGPTPPRTHGLATAALVLGIIGVVFCFLFVPSLLAVIFGAASLSAIKKSDGYLVGRSRALWGLALGVVGLVIFAGVFAFGLVSDNENDTRSGTDIEDILDDIVGDTAVDDGNTGVFAVDVGQCILVPALDVVVRSLEVVDCTDPHDGEVYALGQLDKDGAFPGDEEVAAEVDALCTAEFEGYVGVDVSQSIYGIIYFAPIEQAWNLGNTRYSCVVTASPGQALTDSVRGAGR